MVTKSIQVEVLELNRVDPITMSGPTRVKVTARGFGLWPNNEIEYLVDKGEEPKIGQRIKVTIEQDFYGTE